jgi:hypothetical protein
VTLSLLVKPPNVELLAETTYKLIRPFEAMALLLQATNLFMSAVNDRYRPGALPLLFVLGTVHLVLAAMVVRYRGPLTRKHAWLGAWIASIFTTQMLIARLLEPGDFAAYGNGVPVGNYSLIPLAVLAFYPWGRFRNDRQRLLIEAVLLVAVSLHPLLILHLMHDGHLTSENWRSLLQYVIWAVVWVLIGKGLARLCRIAAHEQSQALLASYEAAVGDFHSYVDSAGRRIAAGHDAREVAEWLRNVTHERKRRLLMVRERTPASEIVQRAVDAQGSLIPDRRLPQVGNLTLPPVTADVLEWALADLVKNVAWYGDGRLEIDFTLEGSTMIWDVRDHGPGLSPQDFQGGSNLPTVQRALRNQNGDLQLRPPPSGGGTALRIILPLPRRR